jgi:hypothetical protein
MPQVGDRVIPRRSERVYEIFHVPSNQSSAPPHKHRHPQAWPARTAKRWLKRQELWQGLVARLHVAGAGRSQFLDETVLESTVDPPPRGPWPGWSWRR